MSSDIQTFSTMPRTDHQVLVSIAALLEELVAEIRHLRSDINARAGSASSVEVKTSTRGVDICAKSYADSPIDVAGDAAVDEYFRVMAQVQAQLDAQTPPRPKWAEPKVVV